MMCASALPGRSTELRRSVVAARQLRDLLRPLVDPRAKERRAALFGDSPLLGLPWHLRVHLLEFVVATPIRAGWGREEFRPLAIERRATMPSDSRPRPLPLALFLRMEVLGFGFAAPMCVGREELG